jgi:hypothetical protein
VTAVGERGPEEQSGRAGADDRDVHADLPVLL